MKTLASEMNTLTIAITPYCFGSRIRARTIETKNETSWELICSPNRQKIPLNTFSFNFVCFIYKSPISSPKDHKENSALTSFAYHLGLVTPSAPYLMLHPRN